MKSNRIVPFASFMILLIISLFLAIDSQPALSDVGNPPTSPVSHYSPWERWSDFQSSASFDIADCGHPRNHNLEKIVTADFNGDGRSDLLCMLQISSIAWTEAVALATDDGYSEWSIWGTSIGQWADGNCQFVPPADVNGDGFDDQLCLWIDPDDGSSTLYSHDSTGDDFLGFGQGIAFESAATFDPHKCRFFQTVDIEDDGDIDILCHYLYPDNSSVTFYARYPAQGDTRRWFELSPVAASNIFRIDYCATMEVGDVDGNGFEDLICSYVYPSGNSATFVQLLDGSGASAWTLWSETDNASDFDIEDCQTLQTGELDGDGLTDRICIFPQSLGGTKVMVQTDSDTTAGLAFGNWEDWTVTDIPVNFSRCIAFSISVPKLIDANGDGLSDLICAYLEDDGGISTYVQLSTGTAFTGWQIWQDAVPGAEFNGTECVQILLGDADGDRATDLICPYLHSNSDSATHVQRAELYRIYAPIIMAP